MKTINTQVHVDHRQIGRSILSISKNAESHPILRYSEWFNVARYIYACDFHYLKYFLQIFTFSLIYNHDPDMFKMCSSMNSVSLVGLFPDVNFWSSSKSARLAYSNKICLWNTYAPSSSLANKHLRSILKLHFLTSLTLTFDLTLWNLHICVRHD